MIGYLASVKIRAPRSMPSSTEAGWPSIRQAGSSVRWWLKNHDLPSTQALLASVMRSPSTFKVMSSQTQPQNVQVASSTILSPVLASVSLRSRYSPPRCGRISCIRILRVKKGLESPAGTLNTVLYTIDPTIARPPCEPHSASSWLRHASPSQRGQPGSKSPGSSRSTASCSRAFSPSLTPIK